MRKYAINFGFTLAEVLITLGVIGVVAAMTMPTLIQNYRKHVVETRLKQDVSILQQSFNKIRFDFDNNLELFEPNDPDVALEMLNKYYGSYIKFIKTEKGEKGAFGYLSNGSALYFYRYANGSTTNPWANVYMAICITAKACQNIDETTPLNIGNGKDVFLLYHRGEVAKNNSYSADDLTSFCINVKEQWRRTAGTACSIILQQNGWKIPKDYPIRF